MSTTDKGVLIFNEWFEAASTLSSMQFKLLFTAIYNYQIKGIEPPQFKNKTETVASVIFPHIKRRMDGARYAKGGYTPKGDPSWQNYPTPAPKEEKRKEKNSQSISESEKDEWQEFFDLAVARSLGESFCNDSQDD